MRRTNLFYSVSLSIAILLSGCSVQPAQEVMIKGEAASPQAEWDKASRILMHTPGMELFNGVVNPAAGLFEYYFDVDSAAAEHRGYIAAIEAQGIEVVTVQEILEEAPIELLRNYVAGVLEYNIDNMPNANAEEMEAYRMDVIAQMSRNDLIRCMLLHPSVILHETANNTGVGATYEQTPMMNLYFMRDQSINTPRGLIMCNMNSKQRASETQLVKFCYDQLGIEPIVTLDSCARLEGGDYIPAGNQSFIGCGMRTNIEAINQIMAADGFGHNTVAVVKDRKWWQMQMHLDTYFNIIDRDLCTLTQSRFEAQEGDPEWVTVDIYSRENEGDAYTLTRQDVPFVAYLQECGYTIIPISFDDEMHYANNFLTIAPRHILAVGGQSEALQATLVEHNVTVEWIPLENLIKGYGAAHCMTQVLERVVPVEETEE